MLGLYPRHFLDISTRDLILAASGSGFRSTNAACETIALERDIDPATIITLSVRSAWDLLLTALDFPAGSEILMSAVTIPDMKRIAESHGLVVVPVDVDPATMAPCITSFARAFSERTQLVILAHLLGGEYDVTPYVTIASSHDVPIVEDRAQAFTGPGDWGSARTLASFHSFGSIKTCTALGGAVTIVRNAALLANMREIQSRWAFQEPSTLSRKARKYLAVQGLGRRDFMEPSRESRPQPSVGWTGSSARPLRDFARDRATSCSSFSGCGHRVRRSRCCANASRHSTACALK
jgi:hypothetical protein